MLFPSDAIVEAFPLHSTFGTLSLFLYSLLPIFFSTSLLANLDISFPTGQPFSSFLLSFMFLKNLDHCLEVYQICVLGYSARKGIHSDDLAG